MIEVGIDKASEIRVQQAFDGLGDVPWFDGINMVLVKMKSLAQLRLTDRGHIITSRLKNSIYVKSLKQTNTDAIARQMGVDNSKTYQYAGGNDSRDLLTVKLGKNEGAVGTNVEYAGAIERGARPHKIMAKKAKVLSDGKNLFGKSVNHPGFRGDSFLYWSVKNINKDIGNYFREIAKNNKRKYMK